MIQRFKFLFLWFSLRFFLRTGCTQTWLERVFRELMEKDIHPANVLVLTAPCGHTLMLSCYGSQVHVSFPDYEFTLNWMDKVGFYVHEKHNGGDWQLSFRQQSRQIIGTQWVKTMKLLSANMDCIDDRTEESMVWK